MKIMYLLFTIENKEELFRIFEKEYQNANEF